MRPHADAATQTCSCNMVPRRRWSAKKEWEYSCTSFPFIKKPADRHQLLFFLPSFVSNISLRLWNDSKVLQHQLQPLDRLVQYVQTGANMFKSQWSFSLHSVLLTEMHCAFKVWQTCWVFFLIHLTVRFLNSLSSRTVWASLCGLLCRVGHCKALNSLNCSWLSHHFYLMFEWDEISFWYYPVPTDVK